MCLLGFKYDKQWVHVWKCFKGEMQISSHWFCLHGAQSAEKLDFTMSCRRQKKTCVTKEKVHLMFLREISRVIIVSLLFGRQKKNASASFVYGGLFPVTSHFTLVGGLRALNFFLRPSQNNIQYVCTSPHRFGCGRCPYSWFSGGRSLHWSIPQTEPCPVLT